MESCTLLGEGLDLLFESHASKKGVFLEDVDLSLHLGNQVVHLEDADVALFDSHLFVGLTVL